MTSVSCRAWAAIFTACVAVSGLQGCVSWPKEARGGLAERQRANDPVLVVLRRAFRRLSGSGALKTHPAMMLEAQLLMIRAHREHAGGLRQDYRESARAAWTVMTRIDPAIGPFDPPPAPNRAKQDREPEGLYPNG